MGTLANESLEIETTGMDLHDETTEAMIVAASEAELVDSIEVENTVDVASGSELDVADGSVEIESEVVADVIELKPEDLSEPEKVNEIDASAEEVKTVELDAEEDIELEVSEEAVFADSDSNDDTTEDDAPAAVEVAAESENISEETVELEAKEDIELEAVDEAVIVDNDSNEDATEVVEVAAESENISEETVELEAAVTEDVELEADGQENVELEDSAEVAIVESDPDDDSTEVVEVAAESDSASENASEEVAEEATEDAKPSRSRALLLTSLLSTTKPISLKELKKVLKIPEKAVLDAIVDLKTTLYEQDLGLMMEEVAGGYRVIIQPALYTDLAELIAPPPLPQLSGAALETLAIIGYKQPITRGELEAARGTGCSSTLDTLQERDLIKIVGQKDVVGKPLLYGTTERFLLEFGLKSLEDLPPLDEKPTEFLRS